MLIRLLCCATILIPVQAVETTPTADRRWFDFSGSEPWGVWWDAAVSGAAHHSSERTDDGLVIRLTAHDREVRLPIVVDHRDQYRASAAATGLTMRVVVESGDGLSLNLRLIDADGEWFDTRLRKLSPGSNTLSWKLPDDLGAGWDGRSDNRLTGEVRIWEVAVLAEPSRAPAALRLVQLETVGEPFTAAAGVEVRLVSNRPGQLLEPADPLPELVVRNRWKIQLPIRLQTRIEEFDGAKRDLTTPLTLPAAAELRWRIPAELSGPRLGLRWLDWSIADGIAVGLRGRERYAVIHPPGRAPAGYTGFQFGMNGVGDGEELCAIGERLGITLCRTGWQWALVQPTKELPPERWEWNAEGNDDNLALLERHGIAVHAIVSYNALWNAPESAKEQHQPRNPEGPREWDLIFTYPEDLVAYRRYVREFMERYGKRLWSVSPWNEPGWFTETPEHPEWYDNQRHLEMQQIVFEEARRVRPELRVGTGGFANVADPVGLQQLVIREAQPYYDLHITHEHGLWDYFKQAVATTEGWRRQYGATDKPFLFDETAWNIKRNTPRNELEVAEHLARVTPYVWSHGAVGHCWFEMDDNAYVDVAADDDNDQVPGWERWGVFDSRKRQPRAAAAVFAAQVGLLRGKICQGQLATDTGSFAIAFGGDPAKPGEQVVARWIDPDDRAEQVYVLAAGGAAHAEAVDLMGNPTAIALRDDLVPLVLGRQPGWLRVGGATSPVSLGGRILRVVGPLIVEPGEPVTIELTNPTRSATSIEVGFDRIAMRRVVLAAGSATRVQLAAPSVLADAGPVTLVWRFPDHGAGWAGTVSVPLTTARRLSAAPADGRVADFFIGTQASDVDNRFSMLLGDTRLRWQGAKDCSAQAWLSLAADQLVLRVEVLDDVHLQPDAGADQWRGDGIQFGIDQPGWTGFWELGVARLGDGRTEPVEWHRPSGATRIIERIQAVTEPIPGGLRYEVHLPLAALTLDRDRLAAGFRFNLVVNDLDEGTGGSPLRESSVFLAHGLHDGKDPSKWLMMRR